MRRVDGGRPVDFRRNGGGTEEVRSRDGKCMEYR